VSSISNQIPDDLKFLASHEWARLLDNGEVQIGISDHAQDALGELVYVELPEIGDEFAAGAETAVVESVKAASDVFAPIAGEITAVNDALEGDPALVNSAAESNGWLYKMKVADVSELSSLMDLEAYKALIA